MMMVTGAAERSRHRVSVALAKTRAEHAERARLGVAERQNPSLGQLPDHGRIDLMKRICNVANDLFNAPRRKQSRRQIDNLSDEWLSYKRYSAVPLRSLTVSPQVVYAV